MCCQPCSCDPFTSCQVVPRQRTHGKDADLGHSRVVVRVQHRLHESVWRAAVVDEGADVALAQALADDGEQRRRLDLGRDGLAKDADP